MRLSTLCVGFAVAALLAAGFAEPAAAAPAFSNTPSVSVTVTDGPSDTVSVPPAPHLLRTGGASPDPSSARRGRPRRQRSVNRNGRHAAYINPFTDPGWLASRIDMGVDWNPLRRLPVRALGDALILGADGHQHWPGGHIIWYQLLDGDHAGDVIYVAEHLTGMLRPGTKVRAGQAIATALPGYPWTEWGWADPDGSPRASGCYHEGQATNSGKEMARFMESLGAEMWQLPGPGTNQPSGRPC